MSLVLVIPPFRPGTVELNFVRVPLALLRGRIVNIHRVSPPVLTCNSRIRTRVINVLLMLWRLMLMLLLLLLL